MDIDIRVQTPPPTHIHIPVLPPNIKVKHKKVKANSKIPIHIPKVVDPNSKNQTKKKAKQNAKTLSNLINKLNKFTYKI